MCLFALNIKCLICYLEDPSSADIGLIPLGPEFAIPPLAKSTITNNRLYTTHSLKKNQNSKPYFTD